MEAIIVTDYREACRVLDKVGRGTVRAKDGRTHSGPLVDIESKWDDPRGVGCIAIKTCETGGYDIYADEFECLLEGGEEGQNPRTRRKS